MRLHYHEAGPWGNGATIGVVARRRGPGASSWSNFGRNIGVLAEHFPRAGRSISRAYRPLGQAHRGTKQYNRYSATRAAETFFDHLGIETRRAGWAIRWAAAPPCASRW